MKCVRSAQGRKASPVPALARVSGGGGFSQYICTARLLLITSNGPIKVLLSSASNYQHFPSKREPESVVYIYIFFNFFKLADQDNHI